MQTQEKSFLLLLLDNFPEKNVKLFVMAMIKREILTSRKVVYTKAFTLNHFLFCKKMLSKTRIFLD